MPAKRKLALLKPRREGELQPRLGAALTQGWRGKMQGSEGAGPRDDADVCPLLQLTRDDRGWFISPLGPNPWWTVLAAFIPALICTILVFMDQHITVAIVNRKDHKLKVRGFRR